ncbi:hypothetical protein CWB98_07340 [Pseudoalteromonas rubra]|uniref:Uncharacterized protein n=1 Tax=Pseudoalteromonas rubra TaxID=43658 RepID=A0A5S3X201_9GAMM|nr:hypothetical protein CWB98_07340 [Pseudoalteromonas rubra]
MIKFSSALLVFMLLPQLVYACMFPELGEEYDALIKIEKQQGENTYKLSVPRLVKNSSGWPTVTLIYSSEDSDKNVGKKLLVTGRCCRASHKTLFARK